jgi:hypothetical protein
MLGSYIYIYSKKELHGDSFQLSIHIMSELPERKVSSTCNFCSYKVQYALSTVGPKMLANHKVRHKDQNDG